MQNLAHTLLRVDLQLYVEVDAQYQQIGDDVQASDAHQDLRVLEGYLLRNLHHAENDHQVGARTRDELALGFGVAHDKASG